MGKEAWWFAAATAGGMIVLLAGVIISDAIVGRRLDIGHVVAAVVALANLALLALATVRLRTLYRKSPSNWTGRWQLSLSDMILLVFVAGVMLAFFRSFLRAEFLTVGVPWTAFLWVSYVVALLFATRFGEMESIGRWVYALALLVIAALVTATGMFMQVFSLLILFRVLFDIFGVSW